MFGGGVLSHPARRHQTAGGIDEDDLSSVPFQPREKDLSQLKRSSHVALILRIKVLDAGIGDLSPPDDSCAVNQNVNVPPIPDHLAAQRSDIGG